jgi:deferrochelatase/peroxidase EfeB
MDLRRQMSQTIKGAIVTPNETISTEMVLDGTRILRMAYTFPRAVTEEEVMNAGFLLSFHASRLFGRPTLSNGDRTATFIRQVADI